MSAESFLSAFSGKPGDPGMRARDSSPRACKSGIQLDGALVSSQSFSRTFVRVAIFIKAALQIQFMRLDIFRPAFFRCLHLRLNFLFRTWVRSAESAAQLFDDRLREFGLDCEHVLQVTGIIFRPKFLAGVGASEPGRDP